MINLIRCDDRLIHGQCMTRIVQHYFIRDILVVDEFTATNPIMKLVFEKAVPPSMKAEVYTVKDAVEPIRKAISDSSQTLVLFRNPAIYAELLELLPELPKSMMIGPVAKRENAREANTGTYITPQEASVIAKLCDQGVEVYFQIIPDQKRYSWDEVRKKIS